MEHGLGARLVSLMNSISNQLKQDQGRIEEKPEVSSLVKVKEKINCAIYQMLTRDKILLNENKQTDFSLS